MACASGGVGERLGRCGPFQLRQQLPGYSRPEGEDEYACNANQDVVQLRVHRSDTVSLPELELNPTYRLALSISRGWRAAGVAEVGGRVGTITFQLKAATALLRLDDPPPDREAVERLRTTLDRLTEGSQRLTAGQTYRVSSDDVLVCSPFFSPVNHKRTRKSRGSDGADRERG